SMFTLWLVLVLIGYTAMYWALGNGPLSFAFTESGSALLTLGFAQGRNLATIGLMFTEAAIGLGLLALFIAYLPSLYGAFSRREAGVSKVEVRAGRPPSGVYLIQLAWTVGRMEILKTLWPEWEDWFVEVDETHTSFPPLVFFRSGHPDESWVTSAGAILDAASLYVSSVDTPPTLEPEFMIRAGYLCLRHIAAFFWIPVGVSMQRCCRSGAVRRARARGCRGEECEMAGAKCFRSARCDEGASTRFSARKGRPAA
ncbi:MAG TPA: hypothetical protein VGL18_01195, partial [Actinomycetota bacterium]